MRKTIIRLLQIIMFPFYASAYALSYALKMQDRENMPTIKEWFCIEEEEELC